MKYICLALVLVTLGACACPYNRCVSSWTYTYTPLGQGGAQWVITPQYAQ
jgi:hypothetical protein